MAALNSSRQQADLETSQSKRIECSDRTAPAPALRHLRIDAFCIGPGAGPHAASLRCECGHFRQWIAKRQLASVEQ